MYQSFVDVFQSLIEVGAAVGTLAWGLLSLLLAAWLLLLWVAWWLWGVDWAKAWGVLAQGGWVPLVLLVTLGALVWSQILPHDLSVGFASVPNFWWQFAAAGLLACTALFCGWLQGVMGWMPEEIPIYPAEGGHDRGHGQGHDHGHGHGHDNGHGHGGHSHGGHGHGHHH